MDLTYLVHSTARALEGLRANRLRLVRSVAIVIGISLSMTSADRSEAQNQPIKTIRLLADKQLTNKQYKCHNEIIYRESSWNINARTGSHYGLYQGRSKYLKNAPADVQFWWFWYYTANRYGVTKYDEPNYCVSLAHLKRYGWQ
jgi:hypothetical protein